MKAGAAHAAQVLHFTTAGEARAVNAGVVREIIRPRVLTRVPHAPPHVLGVTNLRGTVLPVLSAAVLLGHEDSMATGATRILVLDGAADGTGQVGLLVDAVASIGAASGEAILDVAALLAASASPLARAAKIGDGGLAQPGSRHTHTAGPAAAATNLICVHAAGQDYALPLEAVVEVTIVPDSIAKLPGSDAAMLGSTDYRGRLLAVLSLNELLGMPRPPAGARTRMVVVRLGAHQAGLVVDAAKDVLRVDPRRLEAVPPILSRGRGEARIAAICRLENGARLVSVLSPEQLLDAATLDALAAFGATEAAATAAPAAAADATRRLVAFRIGNEIYALPLEIVDEVVRSPGRLARVPHAPALLRGVMNLRGRVVPVIDPSVRFASRAGVAARTGNESTGRVVIVTIDGVQVGLAVDELRDILSLPAEALRPAPELTPLGDRMVDRVALGAGDGSMMLVLDPQAVLAHAERDLLTDIARRAGNQASA